MIKRFDMSAYCYRCGSAEGSNAVVIDHDEDKNGNWVRYEDYEAERSAMCEANSNAVLGEVRAVLKAWDDYWELYYRDAYTGEEFEIVSSGLENAIDKLRKVSEHFS